MSKLNIVITIRILALLSVLYFCLTACSENPCPCGKFVEDGKCKTDYFYPEQREKCKN